MSQSSRKPTREQIDQVYDNRRLPAGTEKTVTADLGVVQSKMKFVPKHTVKVETREDGQVAVTLRVGECPCAVCGCESMLECDPDFGDHSCCSGFCT